MFQAEYYTPNKGQREQPGRRASSLLGHLAQGLCIITTTGNGAPNKRPVLHKMQIHDLVSRRLNSDTCAMHNQAVYHLFEQGVFAGMSLDNGQALPANAVLVLAFQRDFNYDSKGAVGFNGGSQKYLARMRNNPILAQALHDLI